MAFFRKIMNFLKSEKFQILFVKKKEIKDKKFEKKLVGNHYLLLIHDASKLGMIFAVYVDILHINVV
jgi:hypothetical protein